MRPLSAAVVNMDGKILDWIALQWKSNNITAQQVKLAAKELSDYKLKGSSPSPSPPPRTAKRQLTKRAMEVVNTDKKVCQWIRSQWGHNINVTVLDTDKKVCQWIRSQWGHNINVTVMDTDKKVCQWIRSQWGHNINVTVMDTDKKVCHRHQHSSPTANY